MLPLCLGQRMQSGQLQRREFVMLIGGAAYAWPLAAHAQQPADMRRIGVLSAFGENDPETQRNLVAFREALAKRGWTDGRNVKIDYRWGDADPARIRAQATELVGLRPDVILVSTALALQPVRQVTNSIPIVFTQIVDAVSAGLVSSLAHPGGNVTGFTVAESSMFGKLLEVLKELAPDVTRVAVVLHPDQAPQAEMLRAIEVAAPSFRVQLAVVRARSAAEIEQSIDQFAAAPDGGLIVLPNPVTIGNRQLIIAMASRRRLPAAYAYRFFVAEGGLISYGIDIDEQYRQAASYVNRILRGEKPADLPVQQPTKFELVVNLKTANALGLNVPPMLLGRADEVIE
jgi:putative ABC transport system substrate-binding protein